MGLGEQSDLVSVARNQMPNDEAVTLLKELSDGGRGEYLSSERRQTRLNDIVPGVKFTVIGPPTPKQWPRVARQADASDEFWVGAEKEAGRLFAEPAPDARRPPLGTARWIVDKLRDGEQEQVTGLARWLDDAMNNTSVVLLLEAGKHRLLFGGDAQVEAWGWVLNQSEDPGLRAKLRDVDLYKVGHHGSRNASPRKLVKLWQDRPRAPFLSMLSTKRGVHGSGEHVVPRPTLVKALKALGPVLSTDETEADWLQVTAICPTGRTRSPQPRLTASPGAASRGGNPPGGNPGRARARRRRRGLASAFPARRRSAPRWSVAPAPRAQGRPAFRRRSRARPPGSCRILCASAATFTVTASAIWDGDTILWPSMVMSLTVYGWPLGTS